MSVLGIDPSLTGTGIAYDGGRCTIHTSSDQTDGERLERIYSAVLELAAQPTRLAVVEDLPTHGMGAGRTGMAQGVVRLALHNLHIPLLTVTPATLKKYATGKGNAGKGDMRMALYQRLGLDLRDDNQVDALFLRHLGLHLLGEPVLDLPQVNLSALVKLALPLAVA